jgi:hypothetical protein
MREVVYPIMRMAMEHDSTSAAGRSSASASRPRPDQPPITYGSPPPQASSSPCRKRPPLALHPGRHRARALVVADVVPRDLARGEGPEQQRHVDRVQRPEPRVRRGMIDAEQVHPSAGRGALPCPPLRRLDEQVRGHLLHLLVRCLTGAGAQQERRLVARRSPCALPLALPQKLLVAREHRFGRRRAGHPEVALPAPPALRIVGRLGKGRGVQYHPREQAL